GRDTCALHGPVDTAAGGARHAGDVLDQAGASRHPAHAPASHGERLRERVGVQQPVVEAFDLHGGDEGDVVEDEVVVDLVRQHQQAELLRDLRGPFQFLTGVDHAGGVVGVADDHQLRVGRARRLAQRVQVEVPLVVQRDPDDLRAVQHGDVRVGGEGRLGDEDLVAGVQERADGGVERATAAVGDRDIAR